MIIRRVKLTNIRSYTSETVEFPSGSVLLSGDIGSGKSTVLLAVEFALFGIMRGALSGESLLRNGKNEGSVELYMDLAGKEVIIKRTLKRSKDKVDQKSGFIITDGLKKEGTAQELKSDILALLGYPQELLTRKSLIYRYTVYTPQEEMRQILMEDKEQRLDTLRKVFGIDRYKRISENSQVLLREMRDKKKEYEGMVSDLDEKRKELESKKREAEGQKKTLTDILPKVDSANRSLIEIKDGLAVLEKDVESLRKLKSSLDILEARLKDKVAHHKKNKLEEERVAEELFQITRQIDSLGVSAVDLSALEKEIREKEDRLNKDERHISALKEKINAIQHRIEDLDKEIRSKSIASKDQIVKKASLSLIDEDLKNKAHLAKTLEDVDAKIRHSSHLLQKAEIDRANSRKTKDDIAQYDRCPTCHQDVAPEYKKSVKEEEDTKISIYDDQISKFSKEQKLRQDELDRIKKDLEALSKREIEAGKLKAEIEGLEKISAEIVEKQRALSTAFAEKAKEEDSLKHLSHADHDAVRNEIQQKKDLQKKVIEKNRLSSLSDEKNRRKAALLTEIDDIKAEVGAINIKKAAISKDIEGKADLESHYIKSKEDFVKAMQKHNDLLVEKVRFEGELKASEHYMNRLDQELNSKFEIKKKLDNMSQMQQWLSESFLKLMSTMEKHIMQQVFFEFNDLFRQWFSLLIDDENISARLDDEFTPIVEQNGYDIDVSHMSGGERTALAMAYRLSLNKVINDFISSVRTKDIIILDEPTDGFSSEQLDKVKDVLDQLGIKQVIIVSHESKIESFVENVIRIEKNEHISSVS